VSYNLPISYLPTDTVMTLPICRRWLVVMDSMPRHCIKVGFNTSATSLWRKNKSRWRCRNSGVTTSWTRESFTVTTCVGSFQEITPGKFMKYHWHGWLNGQGRWLMTTSLQQQTWVQVLIATFYQPIILPAF